MLIAMVASSDWLAAGTAAALETTPARALEAYIYCDGFAGGVRAVTLDRRPRSAEPWREVGIGGNNRRVSVVDGYRLTYSYARKFAFATLRAERSELSRYPEDKAIVAANFAEMASADPTVALAEFSYRDFSVQMLTKKQLSGQVLASAQIFSDDKAVIVTISFLNQLAENRSFQTYEEFIGQRDAFLRGYLDCVAGKQ